MCSEKRSDPIQSRFMFQRFSFQKYFFLTWKILDYFVFLTKNQQRLLKKKMKKKNPTFSK